MSPPEAEGTHRLVVLPRDSPPRCHRTWACLRVDGMDEALGHVPCVRGPVTVVDEVDVGGDVQVAAEVAYLLRLCG